jgi:hypothetical protein
MEDRSTCESDAVLYAGRAVRALVVAVAAAGLVTGCTTESSATVPPPPTGAPVVTSAAPPPTTTSVSPDGSVMEYQEAYHGQDFVVTTSRGPSGWTYRVAFLGGGERPSLASAGGEHHATSDEALSAARSAVAAAVDAGRTGTGKP